MAKRRKYSPAFKARVALAALANEKTVAELSAEFGIHQNRVNKWKAQLKESASGIFLLALSRRKMQKGKKSCMQRSASSRWNAIF